MISSMEIEREAIEILRNSKLHNESCVLDYKVIPHKKGKERTEFIKDFLALLNSYKRANEDRWLIYGVNDKTLDLVGVRNDNENLLDDANYQEIIEQYITPSPYFEFRRIDASLVMDCPSNERCFGVFYIPAVNVGRVYEVRKDCKDDESNPKARAYCAGQSFIRKGTSTKCLRETDREEIRGIVRQTASAQPSYDGLRQLPEAVSFIGQWNENNRDDIAILEELCGMPYAGISRALKEVAREYPEVIDISGEVWKIRDRERIASDSYRLITANDLSRYQSAFIKIMTALDTRSTLRGISWISADGEENIPSFSKEIRMGIAETCAFIANNKDVLQKCDPYSRNRFITEIVWAVLMDSDWRVIESSSVALPLLAEASPDVYLGAVTKSVTLKSGIFDYLSQYEEGTEQVKLGHSLFEGIARVARCEKHFASAMNALISLLEVSPYAKETLIRILLPWKPQTAASLGSRKGSVTALSQNPSGEAWETLKAILPGATTASILVPEPKYMKGCDIPDEVPAEDYVDASQHYLRCAFEAASGKIERIRSLVSEAFWFTQLGMLNDLIVFIRNECNELTEAATFEVWDELKLFIDKHEKYADAHWSLSDEQLNALRNLEEEIASHDDFLLARRLFARNDTDFNFTKDYKENARIVEIKRIEALELVYEDGGYEEVCRLKLSSNADYTLGFSFAKSQYGGDNLQNVISDFLTRTNDDYFTQGFFRGLYEKVGEVLFESVDVSEWDNESKAIFYASLPTDENVWEAAENALGENKELYWRRAQRSFGFNGTDSAYHYVQELNAVGRHDESIMCLERELDNGSSLDPVLVFETLRGYKSKDSEDLASYFDDDLMVFLETSNIPTDDLFDLEVDYYDVVRRRPDALLFRELANDPNCFIDFATSLFNSAFSGEKLEKSKLHDIYMSFFALSTDWKYQPGRKGEEVDVGVFNDWISKVENAFSGKRLKSVTELVGKNLFYAPEDESGFFLAMPYAKYLDEHEDALGGYYMEAHNSRGVHFVDETGEEEEQISQFYEKRARQLEKEGLMNFATTLRSIAGSFRSYGERNKEEALRRSDEV